MLKPFNICGIIVYGIHYHDALEKYQEIMKRKSI